MLQVSRVFRYMHIRPQSYPIFSYSINSTLRQPTQIIHHRISAPISIGSLSGMSQHDIFMLRKSRPAQPIRESLYKGPINPVFTHPFEMTQHGLPVMRTEYLRNTAIGMVKASRVPFPRRIFTHIRPKVYSNILRPKQFIPPFRPVNPTEPRAITFRIKPTLIPAHNLSGQRARIHSSNRWTTIGGKYKLFRIRNRLTPDRDQKENEKEVGFLNHGEHGGTKIRLNQNRRSRFTPRLSVNLTNSGKTRSTNYRLRSEFTTSAICSRRCKTTSGFCRYRFVVSPISSLIK